MSWYIGQVYMNALPQRSTRRLFRFNHLTDVHSYQKFIRAKNKDSLTSTDRDIPMPELPEKDDFLEEMHYSTSEMQRAKKLEVFLNVNHEMISIILLNTRTRKIVGRSFVTVRELFKDKKVLHLASFCSCFSSKLDYSPEIDTLQGHLDLYIIYKDSPLEEIFEAFGEKKSREGNENMSSATYKTSSFGAVEEEREVRFQVFNVFKSKSRKVFIESISLRDESSGSRDSEGLVRFCESPSEIEIQIFSRGIISERIYNQNGRNLERTSHRAVSGVERQGINYSTLKIKKGDKFSDSGIEKVERIDKETLLVIGSYKLILLNSISGELLSSFDYSLGFSSKYNIMIYLDFEA